MLKKEILFVVTWNKKPPLKLRWSINPDFILNYFLSGERAVLFTKI
jgi:hypothetical protein